MTNASNTFDEILASARTLISNGGYDGFSYADIAEVVGIRKASIHHHFPSKIDLVRVLVQQYRHEAESGLASLERNLPGSLEVLKAYAGFWEKCISDASLPFCVCALLASQLPTLPPEVSEEVRAYFRSLSAWLTSVFKRGGEQGLLRIENPPNVEAEAFMATIHGAMLSARAYGAPTVFGAILEPTIRRLSMSSL